MKYPVMQYDEARSLITDGDPLFFSHGNIGGWIIQLFTLSKLTHMAVTAPRRQDRLQAFESTVLSGVTETPLSNMGDFYWISVNRPLSEKSLHFAMSQIGNGYDWWDCINGWAGMANNENMKWQCTEYGKNILRHNGFELDRVDTPHRAFDEFVKMGYKAVFVKN